MAVVFSVSQNQEAAFQADFCCRRCSADNLGLDFGGNASSVRLRVGSYVVAQTDDHQWDWNAFHWDRNTLSLQAKEGAVPSVNYMVFGVTKFESTAEPKALP